ncbi:MAG: glycosyltransferase [Verrucomicrobiota bacterium]|nr:glycosyltransferase [Verrucomicrobiota bacterium]
MEKVAFLYATFPRSTETFVRRELKALIDSGCKITAFSLWGGKSNWRNIRIRKFSKYKLFGLFFWIPFWAMIRSKAFVETLGFMWRQPCPNLQNFNETFLGLGFALVEARNLQKENFQLVHGVWATMPATAVYAIHRLVDIPFSMGAHAYDLFRKGGDWLLPLKMEKASFIRTSSKSSAIRLRQFGVSEKKIKLIHRGLDHFSPRKSFETESLKRLKLIAVGRLVPKKGYFHMLRIAEGLRELEIPFELQIIGDGKLRKKIQNEIHRFKLENYVRLLGSKREGDVGTFLHSADAFLFTGIVDSAGDRDGIPNVIPEAMDAGCLVISSINAGASEAFIDGVSGFSLDPEKPRQWVDLLSEFHQNPESFLRIRKKAMSQVRENFDIKKTASLLSGAIQKTIENEAK